MIWSKFTIDADLTERLASFARSIRLSYKVKKIHSVCKPTDTGESI
jgi:hypothetical protein